MPDAVFFFTYSVTLYGDVLYSYTDWGILQHSGPLHLSQESTPMVMFAINNNHATVKISHFYPPIPSQYNLIFSSSFPLLFFFK